MQKYNLQDRDLCPCHSNLPYYLCCRPFHLGLANPDALQLMRSRYAAYALHLIDYIIATTHEDLKENPLTWKKSISDFCLHTSFQGLDILSYQEEGSTATVTFTAHLFQGITNCSFTEKSTFEKVEGKWLYRKAFLVN